MIKIGDQVEFDPKRRDPDRPDRGKRGTVVECGICGGDLPSTCDDCVNSIAGRSFNGPPNWCYVLWDGTDWIQGVWLTDLRVINVVDQLAEL